MLRPYWPESGGQAAFAAFERARLAAADAILAAGWTPPVEGEQPGCTGAGNCPATAHTHGCYADTEGHCEHPEEHGWTSPGQNHGESARVLPSVEDAARQQVADLRAQYVRNGVCLVCGGGVLNSGEHIDPERHTAEVEHLAATRAVLALFEGGGDRG